MSAQNAAAQGSHPLGRSYISGNTGNDATDCGSTQVPSFQDYRALAREHAPKTPEQIARAAHELAAAGLGDYDIADILQENVNSVRRLLAERISEVGT